MQVFLLQGESTKGETMNKRIRKKKRTQKCVRYKGFAAAQSTYNNHVWIFHDGLAVAHIQCDRRLKRGELRGYIDRHIYFMDHFDEFVKKAYFVSQATVKEICDVATDSMKRFRETL